MPLMKVRLELARTPDHPQGSSECGYEFIAPLRREDGALDVDLWRTEAQRCTVSRFWSDEGERRGHLVHRHNRWAFHYEGEVDAGADEPIFKFDRHSFRPGDYITITEHDGRQHPFRVVEVQG